MKKQNSGGNLNNQIEKLKASPVFALTLGAKELCHSNFWKWLIDKDKNFAKIFFNEIDVDKITSVEREKEHMDIVIETVNGDYVIENKLKSLPKKEQLEDYRNKYANPKDKTKHFIRGIVTGISKPSFDIPKDWEFVDYEKILDGIGNMFQSANLTKDDKIVVKEYIESSKSMLYVIDNSLEKVGETMDCPNFNELSEIKLDDIVKKLQADSFVHSLNKEIREQFENLVREMGWDFDIRPDFSNKSSIVDVRFIKQINGEEISLGVQIQDNKFKKMVAYSGDSTSKRESKDELFKKYLSMGWFCDYDKNTKEIFGKATGQRNCFCSYVTNTYTFVYQYFNIEDYSFDALKEEIIKQMQYAFKIIEHNDL